MSDGDDVARHDFHTIHNADPWKDFKYLFDVYHVWV